VPERRVLLVLTRSHERFYANHVRDIPAPNLLIQPKNQGTSPVIVYSFTYLNAVAPEGVAGFFPSGHRFTNEEAFAAAAEDMFAYAEVYD
jgi:mannose-1-phosphate guanylyltransferase